MAASSQSASDDSYPELSLIRVVQGGGADASDALSQLIKKYEPLIESTLDHYVRNNEELKGDARTAAYEGFWEAVKRFLPDRGSSLGVFARVYVRGAIGRFIATEVRSWQNSRITLDEMIVGDETFEDRIIRQVDAQESITAVRAFVCSLPQHYQRVIRTVIYEDRLQSDVAREIGVGRSAVNNILRKIRLRGQADLAQFNPGLYNK